MKNCNLNKIVNVAKVTCFVAMMSTLQTGCMWLKSPFYRGMSPPQIFNQQVTKEQIVSVVNSNSKAIRSLQAKVQVRATGTPTLSGDLSVEQPSRIRMQVGLLGMTNSGLDIGSNDNEFWVWIKSSIPGGPTPAVLFATHEQYARSPMNQAIPIEPSWIIDSLGLAYFDPRVNHEGPFPRPDGTLEIRSSFQGPAGPMQKSTMVDANTGMVVAQELYRNGVKVAASKASKHQYFKEINASIPRLVEIEAGLNTPQPGKVVIELSAIMPNSIDSTFEGMWQMPQPKNIDVINIAQQAPGAANSGAANSGAANPASPGAFGQSPSPGISPEGYLTPPNQLQPVSQGRPGTAGGPGTNRFNSVPRVNPNQYRPPLMNQYPNQPAQYQQPAVNQNYMPRGFGRN